jgi:hypothetical protein
VCCAGRPDRRCLQPDTRTIGSAGFNAGQAWVIGQRKKADKEKGRAKFAPTFLTCLNTSASTSVVSVETNFFVDHHMGFTCANARANGRYF